MAAPELSESEARFLRALIDRKVRFLVVDLSAAALQGAPIVTQDVDLWFEDLNDPRFREALAEVGGTYIPPMQLNPPMLAGSGVDIVLHMHGLEPFAQEYEHRIELTMNNIKTPALPLRRILASKRALNRPKDRLVIPVIEDTMRAHGEDPSLP